MNWTFNHLKCIWYLNRGKPHNHVVRLLKGSGSRPTLLVQWRPTSALKHQSSLSSIPSSSRSSQLSVTFENERPATVSRCSSRASKAFSIRSDLFMNGTGYSKDDLRILSRQFKIQVRWCLGLMAWCNLVDFFVRNVLIHRRFGTLYQMFIHLWNESQFRGWTCGESFFCDQQDKF